MPTASAPRSAGDAPGPASVESTMGINQLACPFTVRNRVSAIADAPSPSAMTPSPVQVSHASSSESASASRISAQPRLDPRPPAVPVARGRDVHNAVVVALPEGETHLERPGRQRAPHPLRPLHRAHPVAIEILPVSYTHLR